MHLMKKIKIKNTEKIQGGPSVLKKIKDKKIQKNIQGGPSVLLTHGCMVNSG